MYGRSSKRFKQHSPKDYLLLMGEENRHRTDAVLVAEDGSDFPCHSQVLFLHSPVLAGLQGLRQQEKDGICTYRFPLQFKAEDVDLMLLEVYTAYQPAEVASTYVGFNEDSVKGLVSILHMLNMKSLLDRAEAWLVENKNAVLSMPYKFGADSQYEAQLVTKVLNWTKFACHFQMDKFCDACEDVIAEGMVKMYAENAEFRELTPKVLISIMVKSEQYWKEEVRIAQEE